MLAVKTSLPLLLAVLTLPAYAVAQDLPRMPPSGYANVVASNPKGTVDNITYGTNYVARVYTPPGYSTARKYPAMYLMHGLGGSERSWHDNDLYAHTQLDNLIAQGTVDPFIIVFTRNDYSNWSGFGNILINELIPFVEGRYSICANPANRALGGLSMGGMQTINFGFPNADKFHYLMPSSPAPGIQGQSQLFPNGGALAKANLKLVFFSCGSGEVGSYGCNNVDTVAGYVESNGLASILKEFIIQGGGHNAATWRPSFWNYAQLAHQAGFTRLAATCGGGGGGAGGAGGVGGGGMAGGTATGGSAAGGTNGGSGTMGGRAGATGGSAAGGTNGGSGTMGGRAGTGGSNSGSGGSASGAGGSTTQGGATGTSGATARGGAVGTGGATSGSGGSSGGGLGTTGGMPGTGTTGGAAALGGSPATTGGQPPTTGGSAAGGPAVPPGDESGCGCSIPGSGSTTAPLSLFAAAAALVLGRLRRRRRQNVVHRG